MASRGPGPGDGWSVPTSPPRGGGARRVLGVLAFVGGLVGAAGAFVLGVLTANPCGPMADSCDDYGEVTTEAQILFVLVGPCFVVAVIGLLVAVWPRPRR